MPRIICFGESLIDVFAEPGVPLRALPSLQPAPGGAPANVAVALARLGAEVGFIGRVGRDEFGRLLTELLASEGVDVTHLIADPRAPTMLAIVATPSPSQQDFVLYKGASSLLTPEELPQDYIESSPLFICGSVTLSGEARPALLQAVQWVREVGHQVLMDVNLRPAVWPDLDVARTQIRECLAVATVVKLNERELEFLTGTADPVQGSQRLLEAGPNLCCVSLGAEGAFFNNGLASGRMPGYPVQVANTTGSGDAFVAGLAYQLSRTDTAPGDLDEAALGHMVGFANACGALAATQVGAMSALPTRVAVERMVQAGGGG